ncbi:SDR family NAD(P)-dependent oxidoreductase [Rhodococcus sp. T2V]|uniref:SDR family NAD(P)-dependent oxidoreductase n=1 Tax=Rhodococcus sp. T2V TaxID=3034164 RepID=UPI0023E285B8|nr:SDR family NAD(P)-dependent oxidoreductase [Rhodococcus sp. T2V]MDF3311463.1 SDR family NAD(P)-dependent oxidoreductase [Rhodococcus sp. T2V]
MDLNLRGTGAVITGGSSGIGFAIADALAREGVRVAIASRSADRVRAAADRLATRHGREIVPLIVNTGDDTTVRKMAADAFGALGRIDVLVNCAALPMSHSSRAGLTDLADEVVSEYLNVKFMGYLRTARAVVPYLSKQTSSRIINVNGLNVRQCGSIIGSARNSAVSALTKNLADELGRLGIGVVAINPGITRTEHTDAVVARTAAERGLDLAQAERALANNGLGRLVTAEEIATVATFLASPCSSALNGDAIPAGGGILGSIHY